MKVKQLINKLQKLPSNAIVVLSSDSEGNRYAPLSGVGQYKYIEHNAYSGEVIGTDEDDGVTAVVLWPE